MGNRMATANPVTTKSGATSAKPTKANTKPTAQTHKATRNNSVVAAKDMY